MKYASTHYHAEPFAHGKPGFFPSHPTTPAIKTRKAAIAAAIEAGQGHGVSTCRYSVTACKERVAAHENWVRDFGIR